MNNYVCLVGNVGAQPKLISTEKSTFSVFSIAQNRPSQEVDSEKSPMWFDVIAFGKASERAKQLSKGDYVQVEGRLDVSTRFVGETKVPVIRVVAIRLIKMSRFSNPLTVDIPDFDSAVEVAL